MSQKKQKRKRRIRKLVNAATTLSLMGKKQEVKQLMALDDADKWPINVFR